MHYNGSRRKKEDKPLHTYIEVIHTALIAFPLIAMLFTLPYMLYNYHKYGSVFSLKVMIVYFFILYMMTVYFLVILPLTSIASVAASPGVRPQLIPFHFLHEIAEYADKNHVPLWKNQALFPGPVQCRHVHSFRNVSALLLPVHMEKSAPLFILLHSIS